MGVDGAILLWIQENLRGESLNRLFSFYTHMGDSGMIFIVIGLTLLCFRRTRKAGAVVLTALLLGGLFTNVTLKPLVARSRPWLMVEGLTALVEEHDPLSFPSGHTTAAFAFASAVYFVGAKRSFCILSFAAALLMGFSRLYVGVHYPTDVLVGIMVGALAGFLAWQLWKIIKVHKKSSS